MPHWLREVWPYLAIMAVVFVVSLIVLFRFVPRTRLNVTLSLWMGCGITLIHLLLSILAYELGIFGFSAIFSNPLTLGTGLALIVWGAIGLGANSRSR